MSIKQNLKSETLVEQEVNNEIEQIDILNELRRSKSFPFNYFKLIFRLFSILNE